MGIEYYHYLAPADRFREPPPDLAERIDEALYDLGLVDDPPRLFDADGRAFRARPVDRGPLDASIALPRELDLVWRPSEARYAAVDACFGRGLHEGLFFEATLITGPLVKVLHGVGVQDWVRPADWPAEKSVFDHPRFDDARSHHVGLVYDAEARPSVHPARLVSPLSGAPLASLPDDWFDGVFRACVVFDFHKTIPELAEDDQPRVPEPVRARFEEAFGGELLQSWYFN